jgi:hypothetical protein
MRLRHATRAGAVKVTAHVLPKAVRKSTLAARSDGTAGTGRHSSNSSIAVSVATDAATDLNVSVRLGGASI